MYCRKTEYVNMLLIYFMGRLNFDRTCKYNYLNRYGLSLYIVVISYIG